jgi:hypothetical protein
MAEGGVSPANSLALRRMDERVSELLRANNALVERARAAEAERDAARAACDEAADLVRRVYAERQAIKDAVGCPADKDALAGVRDALDAARADLLPGLRAALERMKTHRFGYDPTMPAERAVDLVRAEFLRVIAGEIARLAGREEGVT